MPEDAHSLGAPAPVPDLRTRRLLRRLAQPARHQTFPRHRPSHHRGLRSAGRLGLVLRRRSLVLLVQPKDSTQRSDPALLLKAAVSAGGCRMESKFAEVGGVRLHYLISGKGDPVVFLHGFAKPSHMWLPLIANLADRHTVIAPDLRGFGQSAAPDDGYIKKAMAQDIHALVNSLGYNRIRLVGHDIGLMVAYAYAAQYPAEVDRLVLMEAFLPGIGDWQKVW